MIAQIHLQTLIQVCNFLLELYWSFAVVYLMNLLIHHKCYLLLLHLLVIYSHVDSNGVGRFAA